MMVVHNLHKAFPKGKSRHPVNAGRARQTEAFKLRCHPSTLGYGSSRLQYGGWLTRPADAAPPAGGETSESKQESETQNAPTDGAAAAAPKVPFYKKKWFWLTQLVIVPLGIALLFILLLPIVRAIVQSVVTKTTLGIDEATILNPANDTFTLQMKGQVYHTGMFSAWIEFQEPIQISWL
ncbi:hypothetical protein EV121DRAFT_296535 [Schizophyllum commune]